MPEKHSQGHPHSPETLDFIRQNIDRMSYREIGENIGTSGGAVSQICLRHGIKKSVIVKSKPKSSDIYHVYSDEEIQWVVEHVSEYYSYPQLAKAFNETFSTSIKEHTFEAKFRSLGVYSVCFKRHIPKPKPVKIPKPKVVKPVVKPKPKIHCFTEIEDVWLRRNIVFMTYAEMTVIFNQLFGNVIPTTELGIVSRCGYLGIHRPTNGQFQKGQSIRTLPIFQEVNRDGYIWIKIGDNNEVGKFKDNWMPKHRYIYEQVYGQIPEGYIVIFLDSNRMNFEPENLYAVPRSIHARMTQNHWYTESREHTLTAIRICELKQALKSVGDLP